MGRSTSGEYLDCSNFPHHTDWPRFSAFDEPWKIQYNKGDQNWEDKWGLMDINRNIKPGVKIPSCSDS